MILLLKHSIYLDTYSRTFPGIFSTFGHLIIKFLQMISTKPMYLTNFLLKLLAILEYLDNV